MRTVILAILLAVLFIAPAWGQATCAARDYFAERLADKYGERQAFVGVNHNGALLEVWINPEKRSFSVLLVTTRGWACLAASGEDWHLAPFRSPDAWIAAR